MSNIFTPPGTSGRQKQVTQQGNAASTLYGLLPGEAAYQGQLQQYRNSQLPNLEQGAANAYYDTTQGGRNNVVSAYQAQQQGMANTRAGQANSELAGNPALAQGARIDAGNQANGNTANYAEQVNSPQGEASAWNNYNQFQRQLSPSYSGASQLAGGVYSQPQVPVGQGLGGFLGQAVGSWAGGGYPAIGGILGGLFDGGSSAGSGGSGYGITGIGPGGLPLFENSGESGSLYGQPM